MIIRIAAAVALLVALWAVFRFAMGLRWSKVVREGSRFQEEARGRKVVPHAWKTGISIAASAHLAAVTPHCSYIEFRPASLCDSLLRKELVAEELVIKKGEIPLPRKPGLGIEVDRRALARFEVPSGH